MSPTKSSDAMRDEPVAKDVPPPFLGTWPRVYVAVISSQVVFVIVLAVLAEIAS